MSVRLTISIPLETIILCTPPKATDGMLVKSVAVCEHILLCMVTFTEELTVSIPIKVYRKSVFRRHGVISRGMFVYSLYAKRI